MVNVLADNKILNVFELFMVEVIQELFKQIRKESSLELSPTFTTGKSISTRRAVKGFLDVPCSRTIVKRKSLSNTMIRAYNWLLDFVNSRELRRFNQKPNENVYQGHFVSLHHEQ